MRLISLGFSLILLLLSSYLLLFRYLTLSFEWLDFILCILGTFTTYLLVRKVGVSLDHQFNRIIGAFLEGKTEQLTPDKGLIRTFGLLLLTLLPFLVFLLGLALYSAVLFSIEGFTLVLKLPRVPVALLLGLAVVLFGSGIAVLFGLYRFFVPPKNKTLGIQLKQTDHPALWQMTRQIAEQLRTKPIDQIILLPGPGISVHLEGNLFHAMLGGGLRTLHLGLVSINGLATDELRAILAHEYGHFGNRDTQWSAFTYSMGNSLLSAFRSTPGPMRDDSQTKTNGKGEGPGLMGAVMALNPAYWILFVFVNLFFRVTNSFSRIGEVMADVRAMTLYGGSAFRDGLSRVATNDRFFSEILQAQRIPDLLKEGKTIKNFSSYMTLSYESSPDDLKSFQSAILEENPTHDLFDSHPALKVRVDYSRRFRDSAAAEKQPVSDLFENWQQTGEELTKLYNSRLLAYLGSLNVEPPAPQPTTEGAQQTDKTSV